MHNTNYFSAGLPIEKEVAVCIVCQTINNYSFRLKNVTLYEHVCKDWTNLFQERAQTKSSGGGIKFGED